MTRGFPRALAGLLAGLVLVSCTDVDLVPRTPPPVTRDDKLEVEADFCTREPGTRISPLRVLFVVDTSESMRITDPIDPVTLTTGRERAVEAAWTELLDTAPEGVRVGVMRFSADAQSRTQVDVDGDGLPDRYYTADRTLLTTATAALQPTSRTTNYVAGLSEAYFEMRTELLEASLESLPLSKYVIVFVSDGLPDTDSSDERENSRENIIASVAALTELADLFRVGEFAFHTAYLSAGQGPVVDQEAQDLLQEMAELGNGTFRSFPSGESLSFLFIDFAVIRRVFTLRGLAAVNTNVVLDARQLEFLAPFAAVPDAGMPQAADADMPLLDAGFLEPDAGPIDQGVFDAGPTPPSERTFVDITADERLSCGEPQVDTDGDGLSDDLERYLGANIFLQDTDDDGIRDRLEWELAGSGLDILDPTDGQCFVPNQCIDADNDLFCDCVFDLDTNGICDCADEDPATCDDPVRGLDCIDADLDSFCDCPDLNRDGFCDYSDIDGDGLHDCEEVFYGTARNGGDSDADGFADPHEIRFRASAVEPDLETDTDWDSTPTGIEVLTAGDPWCDDSAVRSRVAYRYDLLDEGLDGSTTCYFANVRNITLVPTADNPDAVNPVNMFPGQGYPGNGWNRVLIYAGEVAFDDPDAFPAYRVACVMARYEPNGNYREPASGRVRLQNDDFIPLEEFDAERDCIWP